MTTIIKGDSNINLDFSTGGRITGDFSNATIANRVAFQTSTTNGNTVVGVLTNGTGTTAALQVSNNSDITAALAFGNLQASSSEVSLQSGIRNAGTYIPMTFYTGGSERMRVDTSGNVLIGTSTTRTNYSGGAFTPAFQIEKAGDIRASITRDSDDASGPVIYLGKTRGTTVNSNTVVANGDNLGLLSFDGADGTNLVRGAAITAQVDGTPGSADMPGRLVFSTTADGAATATERMRIDSSGNLLVGTTTALGKMTVSGGKSIVSSTDAGYGQFQIGNTSSGGEASMAFVSGATAFGSDPTSTNGNQYVWAVGANVYGIGGNSWGIANKSVSNYVAKIAYNSTSWTFSSDERLKDLDGEIANALDKVSGLRAVYYTWKNDEAKKRRVGLIAQDVLAVLPEAVDKPEQATREDGTPNYLGLGMSDVVPLLVAAVKEQQAIITALTARVEALEGTQS